MYAIVGIVIVMMAVGLWIGSRRDSSLVSAETSPRQALQDVYFEQYPGEFDLEWIADTVGLHDAIADLQTHARISLDTETAKAHPPPLNVLTIARPGKVYLFDPLSDMKLEELQPVLDQCEVVCHNASYDKGVLQRHGLLIRRYIDTLIMSRFLARDRKHGLKICASRHLGLSLQDMEHDSWHIRPLRMDQLHYAALDAEATLRLAEILAPMVLEAHPAEKGIMATAEEQAILASIRSILDPRFPALRIFCLPQNKYCNIVVDAKSKRVAKIHCRQESWTIQIGKGEKQELQSTDMSAFGDALWEQIQQVIVPKPKK